MRTYGRPRVLVCDGDPVVRRTCEQALTQAGYETKIVGQPAKAVAAVQQVGFDVLVLDLSLADELLAKLRENDPDTPCLILYAQADFEAAVAALRRGVSDFLRKPCDAGTLINRVDRVLASTHVKADSALLAATHNIFSSLDAAEIVSRILPVVRSLLAADSAALFLLGDVPRAAARLLEQRDPMVLDSRVGDAAIAEALLPGSATVVVQRLSLGERSLGLLCAGRAPGRRGFADADMRRAILLAGHVALAFENARLHTATEEQARRLEQALDRLVVAERVAMLSRLASGLGHEISNPAAAVLAHLELARRDLAAGKVEQVAEALDMASHAAHHVIDVARALRPLAGSSTPGAVDLRAVVDGALLLTSYQLRGRARVVVEAPPDLPAVAGDQAKLGQVFLNLLLNAAQAIPVGGDARHNEVRITLAAIDRDVVARVEDSGPGVPADILPHLFQPSVTTKTSSSGHGMGLAVCRWILEEIGGSIRYLPGRARGAAFEVRVPRAG